MESSSTPTGEISSSTHVQVALATIAANLPEAISHKVPANPDQFVSVPIELVLPQLAEGHVVLSAAELRACAPEYFGALAGHDNLPMRLPLADIVKQLSPVHFSRRQQTRVEVPKEVAPVFVSGGKGQPPVKPAVAQPAPAYRVQPTVTTTTAPVAAPAAPAAPAVASAPTKIAMSPQALAALNGKAPVAPAPFTPAPAVPATSTPTPVPAAPAPVAPQQPAVISGASAPATFSNAAPRSTTVPAAKKTFPPVVKLTGELAVPLSSVCSEWVQEVRAQLVDVDVEQLRIMVPLELLEPAMKSGKILFSWEEVAGWIKPPLPIPPTRKVGEMTVDLPLKVLAPLFMAHHRGGAQKRVDVDEKIPDLFGGGSGGNSTDAQISTPRAVTPAAPAPAPTPAAPARSVTPAPAAPAPVVAAPVVSAPAPQEIPLESVIGNGTGHFSAKDIVANAARLPGVSGAMLAMSDGLLVTNVTPPSVKAETIAAFLPQMFGRMNQYTKELTLGPLQTLTLGVEGGQWHVIKCDMIYFAVLGKRGETLPFNVLAQVATELSRQSK